MPAASEIDLGGLFESAPDALIVLDRDRKIVLMNRQAEVLFGRDRARSIGQPAADLWTNPADGDAWLSAPGSPVELQARRTGGGYFPVEATAGRLDAAGRAIVSLRDISGRRAQEEERVREERARERQMLRAEQMAAIGQVAAGVAHELRNPLTSIKGLVQVNLREAAARGVPAEDLAVIDHEIRRMERTLQTFLDFARPLRPDRRRLDPSTIVERVTALVGGRARKQGVEMSFEHPGIEVWVDADQDQLQQLLLNLVLNSLDAMPHGGAVRIALHPPRDGQVELAVSDTGPGIAPHILPKVFETFVSSKETGVGLGLPVSRRIAEEHGGMLSAENLPGGGACFTLRLPAPESPGRK